MGPLRVPILGAFNWAQSNNNLSRLSVPLGAWKKAEREKSRIWGCNLRLIRDSTDNVLIVALRLPCMGCCET